MNDFARAVSQADVARFAGVTRAAVTQWRRHDDFPPPVSGSGDRFHLGEVIGWLDGRDVPANRLVPGEGVRVTYGDRVRQRLRPAPRADTDPVLQSLRALASDVCGGAPRTDFLYLLLCLAFLRLNDQDRWVQVTRHLPAAGDAATARKLLRFVVATVDASLGHPDLLSSSDAPPTRLRPRTFEPVRRVVVLSAHLDPGAYHQLLAEYVRETRTRDGVISTPTSVARTMVALLTGRTVRGEVTVYDPFARFGELLTEFRRTAAGEAVVQVYAEHPHPADLRLAGMSLAATGATPELAVTSSPPSGGANVLLTNPPFDKKEQPTWLRRCIAALADDGRAAVLMPYGAGYAAGARAYDTRRELIEQGAVHAVVALPARMFPGSSIGVCVWLLGKPTGRAAPVHMVDARHLGRPSGPQAKGVHVLDAADIATIAATLTAAEPQSAFSVVVAPDEVRAHGYSLNPPEYQDRTLARPSADAARAELDALTVALDLPSYTTGTDEGWPEHRLRDLCEIRSGVPPRPIKRAMSQAHTAREAVPVVHPRHLRDGLIEAGDAPDADLDTVEQQHRLQAGDVLYVRTGAMGQTALVRPSESGWLPHTNLLRLRVTKPAELDPAYLLAYLSQAAVQALIRDRSVRSLTTSLSTTTLGDLVMPLPPVADQRQILNALQLVDDEISMIERRLAAARATRTAFTRHLADGTVLLNGEEPS
ncbi:N-6 DNA methylase [Micromonospora sp. RB23]